MMSQVLHTECNKNWSSGTVDENVRGVKDSPDDQSKEEVLQDTFSTQS